MECSPAKDIAELTGRAPNRKEPQGKHNITCIQYCRRLLFLAQNAEYDLCQQNVVADSLKTMPEGTNKSSKSSDMECSPAKETMGSMGRTPKKKEPQGQHSKIPFTDHGREDFFSLLRTLKMMCLNKTW
jgi:hypothetical protein